MHLAGMFLPSVDSLDPDRVRERMVRRNQAAPYVPFGPRDRMVRVPAAGQPPAVDPPPATSLAPRPVQPEIGDVDIGGHTGHCGRCRHGWRRRRVCGRTGVAGRRNFVAFLVLTLMAIWLAWCRQMLAVLALAMLPLLFAHIAPPPPPPRLEWVQSWQAHSSLATCPAPDAQLRGPGLVWPVPLKCCTWVQSCQAHSFLAPFSVLGALVRWGYPPPLFAPPCSSRRWQARSCQACPLTRCEWVQSCQAHSFIAPSLAQSAHSLSYPPCFGASPSAAAGSTLAKPGIHGPVLSTGALAHVAGKASLSPAQVCHRRQHLKPAHCMGA